MLEALAGQQVFDGEGVEARELRLVLGLIRARVAASVRIGPVGSSTRYPSRLSTPTGSNRTAHPYRHRPVVVHRYRAGESGYRIAALTVDDADIVKRGVQVRYR